MPRDNDSSVTSDYIRTVWDELAEVRAIRSPSNPITVDIESYDFDWDQMVANPVREVVGEVVPDAVPVEAPRRAGRGLSFEQLIDTYEEMFGGSLTPAQHAVLRTVDYCDWDAVTARVIGPPRGSITPIDTPFSQAIRVRRPRSNWGPRPMWSVRPDRIVLGYMSVHAVSPWTTSDGITYTQDLPDHGDRVFPMATRRGDFFLPLTWNTSKLETADAR